MPPDQRMVLDGPLLRELELNNRLVRGPNNIVNVQSDFEAGKPGVFHWHPGELTMSVEDLRARYQPEVFNAFERWARATEIPQEERTVWEWINGELGAPFVASVPVTPEPPPLKFNSWQDAEAWAKQAIHPDATLNLTRDRARDTTQSKSASSGRRYRAHEHFRRPYR